MEDLNFPEYLRKRIDPSVPYNKLLEFPQFIEIETVNACNARCPMCTIADWQRDTPVMKEEIFNKIVEDLRPNIDMVRRISLYRDGEPLIDKNLPSRIETLNRIGAKEIAISTNVSLLTEEKARNILNAGIGLVILSIDSLKKDVFESIRVRLNFEEVMENALRFIKLRDEGKFKTRIWVRMIKQDSNHLEWNDYLKFWSPLVSDGDRVYFHDIFNWGGQLDNFKSISKSYEPNLPCVALWSLLVIFANGDVPLCNVDYNNKYPLGNVMEHSIKELWNSKLQNERRKNHLNGRKSSISLCTNCNVWAEPSVSDMLISAEYATPVDIG